MAGNPNQMAAQVRSKLEEVTEIHKPRGCGCSNLLMKIYVMLFLHRCQRQTLTTAITTTTRTRTINKQQQLQTSSTTRIIRKSPTKYVSIEQISCGEIFRLYPVFIKRI